MDHRARSLATWRRLALLALVGGLGAGSSAWVIPPGNWAIQPPAKASLSPTSSVTVSVPADLSAAQLASLAIEIDQIDVTAIARIGAHVRAIVQVELEDGSWRAVDGPGATSPAKDVAPPGPRGRYRIVYVGESGGAGRASEAASAR